MEESSGSEAFLKKVQALFSQDLKESSATEDFLNQLQESYYEDFEGDLHDPGSSDSCDKSADNSNKPTVEPSGSHQEDSDKTSSNVKDNSSVQDHLICDNSSESNCSNSVDKNNFESESTDPLQRKRLYYCDNDISQPKKKKIKVYVPPTLKETNRDIFCWKCHRYDESILQCTACPRVFHEKCTYLKYDPKVNWICSECESIKKAECDVLAKDVHLLKELLLFTIKRMRNYDSNADFESPVDLELFPDYKKYIVKSMCLSILESKIKRRIYHSCESFMADVKWMVHNSYIFNSASSKLTSVARVIYRCAQTECNEIMICPECYLHANTILSCEWFVEPCSDPHLLVWARLHGFPFWPGKVLKQVGMNVDVRFFGDHNKAIVPIESCYLYSKQIPTKVRNEDLEEAIEEANLYIKKLEKKYGSFKCAPLRTRLTSKELLPHKKFQLPLLYKDVIIDSDSTPKSVNPVVPDSAENNSNDTVVLNEVYCDDEVDVLDKVLCDPEVDPLAVDVDSETSSKSKPSEWTRENEESYEKSNGDISAESAIINLTELFQNKRSPSNLKCVSLGRNSGNDDVTFPKEPAACDIVQENIDGSKKAITNNDTSLRNVRGLILPKKKKLILPKPSYVVSSSSLQAKPLLIIGNAPSLNIMNLKKVKKSNSTDPIRVSQKADILKNNQNSTKKFSSSLQNGISNLLKKNPDNQPGVYTKPVEPHPININNFVNIQTPNKASSSSIGNVNITILPTDKRITPSPSKQQPNTKETLNTKRTPSVGKIRVLSTKELGMNLNDSLPPQGLTNKSTSINTAFTNLQEKQKSILLKGRSDITVTTKSKFKACNDNTSKTGGNNLILCSKEKYDLINDNQAFPSETNILNALRKQGSKDMLISKGHQKSGPVSKDNTEAVGKIRVLTSKELCMKQMEISSKVSTPSKPPVMYTPSEKLKNLVSSSAKKNLPAETSTTSRNDKIYSTIALLPNYGVTVTVSGEKRDKTHLQVREKNKKVQASNSKVGNDKRLEHNPSSRQNCLSKNEELQVITVGGNKNKEIHIPKNDKQPCTIEHSSKESSISTKCQSECSDEGIPQSRVTERKNSVNTLIGQFTTESLLHPLKDDVIDYLNKIKNRSINADELEIIFNKICKKVENFIDKLPEMADFEISHDNIEKYIRRGMNTKSDELNILAKRKAWCRSCNKAGKFYCCDGTYYCSTNCQSKMWRAHRPFCKQRDMNITEPYFRLNPDYQAHIEYYRQKLSDLSPTKLSDKLLSIKRRKETEKLRKSKSTSKKKRNSNVISKSQDLFSSSVSPAKTSTESVLVKLLEQDRGMPTTVSSLDPLLKSPTSPQNSTGQTLVSVGTSAPFGSMNSFYSIARGKAQPCTSCTSAYSEVSNPEKRSHHSAQCNDNA